MKRVLVAGATGYLGRFLLQELKSKGYWVRALVRKESQKQELEEQVDEVVLGQATDAESLRGVAENCDAVFSSLGITRQKDGLTYDQVDYGGNLNLLQEAERAGVSSFLYVSVFRGNDLKHVKLVEAKERFVEALKSSSLHHCIIRPTGFFSDMKDFLEMASGGRVYLFGDGRAKLNPIAGADLAEACVALWEEGVEEAEVGGPVTYTHEEIGAMALQTQGKPVRITHVPMWMISVVLWFLRWLTPLTFYGPVEFFLTAISLGDMVAPAHGKETLDDFFREVVKSQ